MITITIPVKEFKPGFVSMESSFILDQPTKEEKKMAKVIDICISVVFEEMLRDAGNGEIIEGKNIQEYAKAAYARAMKQ